MSGPWLDPRGDGTCAVCEQWTTKLFAVRVGGDEGIIMKGTDPLTGIQVEELCEKCARNLIAGMCLSPGVIPIPKPKDSE